MTKRYNNKSYTNSRNYNNRGYNNRRKNNRRSNTSGKKVFETKDIIAVDEEKQDDFEILNTTAEIIADKDLEILDEKEKLDDLDDTGFLDTTTKIRVDEERINDSESLDISFLEGRNKKSKDANIKVKEKILKEKKNSNVFGVFKKIFYLLGLLCIVVLLVLLYINRDDFIKTTKKDKKEVNKVIPSKKEEEIILDDNYLFVGDFYTKDFDFEKFELDYHYVKDSDKDYTIKDILDNRREKIYRYNPSVVFIQLGINDLNDDRDNKEIIDDLKEIIKGIKDNRPYAKIFVESIYPIDKDHEEFDEDLIDNDIDNKRIEDLNKEIKEMVAYEEVNYLDIYSVLSDDGKLKGEYTTDGIHLSEEGYNKILDIIKKELNNLKK